MHPLAKSSTTKSGYGKFEVILEIKSQEQSKLKGEWAAYRFILRKQTLATHMIGVNEEPLGSLNIKGAHAELVRSNEPNKYPFKLNIGKTSVFFFCADSEETREECIFMLNYAAADENWTDPFKPMLTATLDEYDVKIEEEPDF